MRTFPNTYVPVAESLDLKCGDSALCLDILQHVHVSHVLFTVGIEYSGFNPVVL